MKYRHRFQIITSLLKVAQEGSVPKTKLMYGAYLSYYQVNEYLDSLQANGLLTFDDATRKYSLTEKGLEFIHTYEGMVKLFPTNEPIPIVKESGHLRLA